LVAEAVAGAKEPWWIIGSAAMALHGAGPIQVGDVDLLMSRRDAAWLLEQHGLAAGPGSAHDRFRSDVFGSLALGGFPVEVMSGFHVRDGGRWRELVPRSRIRTDVGGAALFIPSVHELIEMCSLFARPKDRERERLLREVLT
jgi:hypothetical protein